MEDDNTKEVAVKCTEDTVQPTVKIVLEAGTKVISNEIEFCLEYDTVASVDPRYLNNKDAAEENNSEEPAQSEVQDTNEEPEDTEAELTESEKDAITEEAPMQEAGAEQEAIVEESETTPEVVAEEIIDDNKIEVPKAEA